MGRGCPWDGGSAGSRAVPELGADGSAGLCVFDVGGESRGRKGHRHQPPPAIILYQPLCFGQPRGSNLLHIDARWS